MAIDDRRLLGRAAHLRAKTLQLSPRDAGIAALVRGAAPVALSGWVTPRKPRVARRWLVGLGVLLVLLLVIGRVADGGVDAKVLPLVLAGLAFLYLWWLGILLFDLAFIWHCYIRQSVAVDSLGHWARGHDAPPMMWPQAAAEGRDSTAKVTA